jgi:hypothetical protein
VEISFPIEFLVEGTPVSAQAARADSRTQWQERVKASSSTVLPEGHFASEGEMSVTMFYFPPGPMVGDIDNIVGLVLDALSKHVYMDDVQVARLLVQKFEPGNVFAFSSPTVTLAEALKHQRPVLYVRVSDDPFEELT